MSVYWNECRRDLRDHNLLGLWALATLLAAVSGPLGSYENCTFLHRLLLWGIWLGLFLLAATGIRAFVLRVLNLREFSRAGPLIAALVAMLISFPVNAMNAQTVLNGDTGPFITASWGEIAAMVFLMSLGLAGYQAQFLRAAPDTQDVTPEAEASQTVVPRLYLRLEPELRGELIAISVRDHYVDVLTTAGVSTLLMRLSDAIAEAAPIEGAQVHRSHWVAWDQVTEVERRNGKMVLHLGAHGTIPVSRNHRAKLDARGFA
jgi:hypothetical protein